MGAPVCDLEPPADPAVVAMVVAVTLPAALAQALATINTTLEGAPADLLFCRDASFPLFWPRIPRLHSHSDESN